MYIRVMRVRAEEVLLRGCGRADRWSRDKVVPEIVCGNLLKIILDPENMFEDAISKLELLLIHFLGI